jgi:negative regulator of sigma E activity
LFLSTWNSDNFAKEILKKWNIYHYFEKVLGSTNIMKSSEHLEEFYKHIQDENFYKNATFIWDWARDREIAESKNLNFIHIGNQWKDKYEISEIKYIETILPFIK